MAQIKESGKVPDEVTLGSPMKSVVSTRTMGRILVDAQGVLDKQPKDEEMPEKTSRLKAQLLVSEIIQDRNLKRENKASSFELRVSGGMNPAEAVISRS